MDSGWALKGRGFKSRRKAQQTFNSGFSRSVRQK
jgi:hypothetical protein